MYIINNNNKIEIKKCTKFLNRFIGLMGKKEINYGLLFPKCNSIHTMFMKINIDVYLCDKNYKILHIYKNLPKNKFILPKKRIYYTYEFPTNITSFQINDTLKPLE